MGRIRSQWSRLMMLAALLIMLGTTQAFFRKGKGAADAEIEEQSEQQMDERNATFGLDHLSNLKWLFQPSAFITNFVGKKIWKALEPSAFWIKMITGIKLEEDKVVDVFVVVSNMAYCWWALVGFWVLPTNFMLILVFITLPIGPAAILIFLVMVGGMAYFAANYPVVFVSLVWISWFVKSHIFQTLGRWYKLDVDDDGVTDLCDLLRYAVQQEWPGTDYYWKLYELLKSHKTPNEMQIEQIAAKLDAIANAQRIALPPTTLGSIRGKKVVPDLMGNDPPPNIMSTTGTMPPRTGPLHSELHSVRNNVKQE